jgi:hypothetical protein
MRKFLLLFFFLFIAIDIYSLDNYDSDSVEINIIDNYITPETPSVLIVSFFTSLGVKSKIIVDDQYEYPVSKNFSENHKVSIEISKLKFESTQIHFIIEVEDSSGKKYSSETYEVDFPKEVEIKEESNFLMLCLLGGTVFLLPSPVYVNWGGNSYFSLNKEIPLVFIRSGGFSYPTGYFSMEYSYIFHARGNPDLPAERNLFRLGYKHIMEVPGIEYLSPGVNGFSNLNGFNGISPELSIGWMKILDTFTLYSRFRYSFKPGEKNSEFSEISIGLYSGFFAIYF